MTSRTTRSPVLSRSVEELIAAVRANRAGYVPAWRARPDDPGSAVVSVQAAMLASLWERLDRVPDKNKLAFLAALGIDALPPAAARAPIVFQPLPSAGGPGRGTFDGAVVPGGSAVGAPGPDGDQIAFRTEHSVGISASPLVEVRSVLPGSDSISDHSREVLGGRPFSPFTGALPVQRSLFIGHDRLLAITGDATVAVEFELAQVSRVPLRLTWSIWDGARWRRFDPDGIVDQTDGAGDGSASLSRSGTVTLSSEGIEAGATAVDGVKSHWLRADLDGPIGIADPLALPTIDQIRLAVELGRASSPVIMPVTSALSAGSPVDLTLPFLPLGPAPDRTAILYLDAADAVNAETERADFILEATTDTPAPTANPTLALEYWNGRGWKLLSGLTPGANGRTTTSLTMPGDWLEHEIDGRPGTWARLRLTSGSYAAVRTVTIGTAAVPVDVQSPALFSELRFELYGRSTATAPDHVVSFDGAVHRDDTESARWRGAPFAPFRPLGDHEPTVYLGFDGPLPAADLGLLFDIEPPGDGSGAARADHEFLWERFDGTTWVPIPVDDETDHLTGTGLVRPTWPGNRRLRRAGPVVATGTTITTADDGSAATFVAGETVYVRGDDGGELAIVARVDGRSIEVARPLGASYQQATVEDPEPPLFGVPRTWIRARLGPGSPQPQLTVNRILTNVAWATESRPVSLEMLGSGNGRPNQRLFSTNAPLLPDVTVEVRELAGARVRTDLAILKRELEGTEHTLVVETGPDGEPDEVWVRWTTRANLASSGPTERHLVVDLAAGVFTFGDDRHARSLPTGPQNVRLSGRSGGGRRGNVDADTITNPLSAMLVGGVSNPLPAQGGAEAEHSSRAIDRAAKVLRHRFQAITAADYASVALEASPEVLRATVVARPDDLGGTLGVHVLPDSTADRPDPSAQLLERVNEHLVARCPPGALIGLVVAAPVFVPVGLQVTLAVRPQSASTPPSDGGPLDRIRRAVVDHLHPVIGGVGGAGWPFGATVHPARFAQLLEAHPDVDYVESFVVTVDGIVAGTSLTLGPAELPLAGPLSLTLIRPEVR